LPAEDHLAFGVGLTYWPALEPFIAECGSLIDVLEVQPETLWYSTSEGRRYCDAVSLAAVQDLAFPKMAHGVGNAVGGSCGIDPAHQSLVNEVVVALDAALVSEHLSFGRSPDRGTTRPTGFLLPPRQTAEGAETAAASARALAGPLPVPFAVENGVSYLQPRRDEMPDGEFLATVVEQADVAILLDLHNAYANERNGRQKMTEFLGQLPLDRVYELHVAGGREHDGFWLDAHCGAVPDAVAGIAMDLIPDLPNVRLINFEFIPAYLREFGPRQIAQELARCHRIWAARTTRPPAPRRRLPVPVSLFPASGPRPAVWEKGLTDLVNPATRGMEEDPSAGCGDLDRDPGVEVLRVLVGEARAGMVTQAMTLTIRLLLLHLGEQGTRDLLGSFWDAHMPAVFSIDEAEGFASHLATFDPGIPHLHQLAAFELAVLRAAADGASRVVAFAGDPEAILAALTEFRIPPAPGPDRHLVTIEAEGQDSILVTFSESQRVHLDA